MQFSTKIDGFEQNDSQGSENSYNSYEQYPLEKFLIFTIYQNYTLALTAMHWKQKSEKKLQLGAARIPTTFFQKLVWGEISTNHVLNFFEINFQMKKSPLGILYRLKWGTLYGYCILYQKVFMGKDHT